MLTLLETLIAFSQHKTMSSTAVSLGVSQSTVSKRIITLEEKLGWAVIVQAGRNVELTEQAVKFLSEVAPTLLELNYTIDRYSEQTERRIIRLGLEESILQTWGAALVKNLIESHKSIQFDIQSHPASPLVESVAKGQFHLGIVSESAGLDSRVGVKSIYSEPMVIISRTENSLEIELKLSINEVIDVICVEKKPREKREKHPSLQRYNLNPIMQVESNFAAAQLALAGVAHAFVPLSVSKALNCRTRTYELDMTNCVKAHFLIYRENQISRPEIKDIAQSITHYTRSL